MLSLAVGLAGLGHDVRVVCHPRGRLRRNAESAGLCVVAVPTVGQTDARAAARLAWFVRRWRPDVLHLHTPKDYLIGTLAGGLSGGTALVFTRHLLLPVKPHMRCLYSRADAVICPCRALRDQLATAGVPDQRLALVLGAIDAEPFFQSRPDRCALRRRLGLVETGPLIGIVGRLVPGKGHSVLLEALSRLETGQVASTLLIIGDGPLQAALIADVVRRGLADRVRFLGFQSDVPGVMAALDILVLASTHSEVLPLVVMEAMAAGCAVVATSVGGVPEIVEDGRSGLLVSPGGADDLALALHRLIGDPGLRADLGQAARERVREEFTLPRMVRETEQVYQGLCDRLGAA